MKIGNLRCGIFAIIVFFVGAGMTLANIFLCESLFTSENIIIGTLSCIFIGLLGVAGTILVVPRSVSGILTTERFEHLFKWRSAGLALLIVPTLLAACYVQVYRVYHDYRHPEFRSDLDLYRRIARVSRESYVFYSNPYSKHPLSPKAIVLTEGGWINDKVQHALGDLGASQATEVNTIIILSYSSRKENRFAYFYFDQRGMQQASIALSGYDIRFVDKASGKMVRTETLEARAPSVISSREISHTVPDPFQEKGIEQGVYKVRKPTPQEIADYLRTLSWGK